MTFDLELASDAYSDARADWDALWEAEERMSAMDATDAPPIPTPADLTAWIKAQG